MLLHREFIIPKDSVSREVLREVENPISTHLTVINFLQNPRENGTKLHFLPKGVKLSLMPDVQNSLPGMPATVLKVMHITSRRPGGDFEQFCTSENNNPEQFCTSGNNNPEQFYNPGSL